MRISGIAHAHREVLALEVKDAADLGEIAREVLERLRHRFSIVALGCAQAHFASYPDMCTIPDVTRQELEAGLRELGWYFLKPGGSHDLWAHPQRIRKLAVPRHREIKEHLARSRLRQATMTD